MGKNRKKTQRFDFICSNHARQTTYKSMQKKHIHLKFLALNSIHIQKSNITK
jgi:hypothetical protein